MSTPVPPTPAPEIVEGMKGDIPQPVKWYKSQRFVILIQSNILLVLGWLVQVLSVTPINWMGREIAVALVGNIFLLCKDWWSPTVIAPFAVLNKNNVK